MGNTSFNVSVDQDLTDAPQELQKVMVLFYNNEGPIDDVTLTSWVFDVEMDTTNTEITIGYPDYMENGNYSLAVDCPFNSGFGFEYVADPYDGTNAGDTQIETNTLHFNYVGLSVDDVEQISSGVANPSQDFTLSKVTVSGDTPLFPQNNEFDVPLTGDYNVLGASIVNAPEDVSVQSVNGKVRLYLNSQNRNFDATCSLELLVIGDFDVGIPTMFSG